MKFIGVLKNQQLNIQGLNDDSYLKNDLKKFFDIFFEYFFTEIFTKDYDRRNFPILEANKIAIFESLHINDIYIIFISDKEKDNTIEYNLIEENRFGVPTLTRKMLDCEIASGSVIFGLQINYSKLTDKIHISDIIMNYINRHK